MSADPELVRAWLTARSIARGLPWPVHDSGGFRVDSAQPDEKRRHLFTAPAPGLRGLGEAIHEPLVALKLCAAGADLMRLLPDRWRLAHDNWMMIWDIPHGAARLSDGYALATTRAGKVLTVDIVDANGDLAARGYAAAHDYVFIYDRIRTEAAHRRRGLGRALVHALAAHAPSNARHVLTATPAGRALYLAMGWRDYCPYATAMIPPA